MAEWLQREHSKSSSKLSNGLSGTLTRGAHRRHWSVVAAVLVFGTGLSVLVAYLVHRADLRHNGAEFERRARQLGELVRTSFHFPLETLHSLPAFFESSEEVTRDEFRTFVSDARQRHPGIYAFQWLPVVLHGRRPDWETKARSDGLSDFEFKELATGNTLVKAAPRAEYLPIFYEEPPHGALGMDVAADAARRAAPNRARQTVAPAASARFKLFEDPESGFAVVIYHPVHGTAGQDRATCTGLVNVILHVELIMQDALAKSHFPGIHAVLLDASAAEGDQALFSSAGSDGRAVSDSDWHWTNEFRIADRQWKLVVAPRADSLWLSSRWSWVAFITGMALTGLTAVIAHSVGRIRRLSKRVEAALQLGQYRLEEKVGEGGMGVVYRASHAMLRRPTAVKLLPPEKSSPETIARFEREVQLTSQLTHPNTIVIFDYGRTPDGVFYYAMEFLDGIDLKDVVNFDGGQPEGRVIHLLTQICGSLSEAHAQRLIHRDIKPANIMLCQRGGQADVVKVLDFGLAKDVSTHSRSDITVVQTIAGTPMFVSPESVEDEHPLDARSDLYAVGAVGYYLLTGQTLFEADSVFKILLAHVEQQPIAPSERLGKPVSKDLEYVILQCLEKDPQRRPQSAAELAEQLAACAAAADWTEHDARKWWQAYDVRPRDEEDKPPQKPARQPPKIKVSVDLAERS